MSKDLAPPLKFESVGKMRTFELDDPKFPDWADEAAMGSGSYPYEKRLKKSAYEAQLEDLQKELVKVQYWMRENDERIMILFEGRDAAGKGGTINRFKAYMNPRHAQTVALSKPTETEMGQWYFQRYVDHFPSHGNMLLYDRSWYNRAGVEPVMGFCSDVQHKKFLNDAPQFEKFVVEEGIHFFKIWLNVGREMQLKRFHERRHSELKRWKLSPIDIKSLSKWDDYTQKRDLMLEATHTKHAPWTIVRTNDKRRGRLNAIRQVLLKLDYTDKDPSRIGEVDDQISGFGPGFLNTKAE